MTTRISQGDIVGMLTRLNRLTNGTYRMDYAYGGCRLERLVNVDSGAVTDISYRCTKGEMYNVLLTACKILEEEKWLVDNAPHKTLVFPK